MLISQALGLNLSQPMLDFVDIDLNLDFPLFIDPIGFLEPKEQFAQECQDDIRDFFETILQAIIAGDMDRGSDLLSALQEPNETHLGVSDGKPRGRGIGARQASQLLDSLANSPAARTGLLQDLTDCSLFIENIGADKISDITTNIIRRNLIEYTQQQFQFHNIPIETILPTGRLWVRGEGRWEIDRFDRIPLINGERVLLVPKRYVRWRGGVQQATSQYYNNFVTNFVRDEQLRTNGHLVRVIRTKKGVTRKVFKQDIRRDMPPTKENLARFSVENPHVYGQFKEVIKRKGSIGLRKIVELDGQQFNEAQFNAEIIALLRAIPTGRPNATNYHHLISGIITYLFFPHLITPTLEQDINQGRKRIDIAFANASQHGFFAEQRTDAFVMAREIMIECKNYAEDLANNEIDQMIGRFDPRRGRFGIVACRSVVDQDRLVERCRDAFRAQQGVILVFTDADFEALLNAHDLDREGAIQNMCRAKFRELVR